MMAVDCISCGTILLEYESEKPMCTAYSKHIQLVANCMLASAMSLNVPGGSLHPVINGAC